MKVRKYKTRSTDTADFERQPDLEGIIVEQDVLLVDKKERPYMVIDTGQRLVRVFHSSALQEAFRLGTLGDSIRLEYQGRVKLAGAKSYKRFGVQVWTEEGEDDEETETPKAV